MKNLSLYIHYPFCKSKCPYCDFNSYCNLNIEEDSLIKAYINEIDYYKEIIRSHKIKTIYFGGGTPSLMSQKLLSTIINKISTINNIDKNCEISLEANPNSITPEKLKEFNRIAINRLSIGVQSLYDEDLKYLGRIHNRDDAINAIKAAQNIFKDRYSIDLIYTRPNQKMENWKKELEEAIQLSPFHLSIYQLIIEKGTQFYKRKIRLPNEDISCDFYKITAEILEKNNIKFYEISNYAKKGYECKHNLTYWTNGEWLGIGAGAHSRINNGRNRYAVANIKNPIKWVNSCLKYNRGSSSKKHLTDQEIIEEYALMGLRIKNGINIKYLKNNIDCSTLYEVLNEKNINFLSNNNFITANSSCIKIRKKYFLLLNSIIEKVLK